MKKIRQASLLGTRSVGKVKGFSSDSFTRQSLSVIKARKCGSCLNLYLWLSVHWSALVEYYKRDIFRREANIPETNSVFIWIMIKNYGNGSVANHEITVLKVAQSQPMPRARARVISWFGRCNGMSTGSGVSGRARNTAKGNHDQSWTARDAKAKIFMRWHVSE